VRNVDGLYQEEEPARLLKEIDQAGKASQALLPEEHKVMGTEAETTWEMRQFI